MESGPGQAQGLRKGSSFLKQGEKSYSASSEYICSCETKVNIPKWQRSGLLLFSNPHSAWGWACTKHPPTIQGTNGRLTHPHPARLPPAPGGRGDRAYLIILGAVGLRLGQSAGGGSSEKPRPPNEQVPNRWIAGPAGAGLLGTQDTVQD